MEIKSSGFEYKASIEPEVNPIKFFPVCIDNFFDNPDEIREWALSLPKEKSDDGHWPGVRTSPLHILDKQFHNTLFLKVLASYFDLKWSDVSWDECRAFFQLITPYSNNEDDMENTGWIHRDDGDDLAGLIYLTPNANLNSGTSLFNLKPEYEDSFTKYGNNPEKQAFYGEDKSIIETYRKVMLKHNNKFYEKTRFNNLYNRCILYDSNEYHKANSFSTGEDERLTLVFFMKGVKSGSLGGERKSRYPLNRVKDYENFDEKLMNRLEYVNTKSK